MLGTILRGPGVVRFLELNVVQGEGFSSPIHGDYKLHSFAPHPLIKIWCRQSENRGTPLKSMRLYQSMFRFASLESLMHLYARFMQVI